MNILFFNKNGELLSKNATLTKTPHRSNIDWLDKKPQIKANLTRALELEIDDFIHEIIKHGNAHRISVSISNKVAKAVPNVPNHKIVASLLLELLEKTDPTKYELDSSFTIIASKGEDQKYFDYFAKLN